MFVEIRNRQGARLAIALHCDDCHNPIAEADTDASALLQGLHAGAHWHAWAMGDTVLCTQCRERCEGCYGRVSGIVPVGTAVAYEVAS